MKKTTTTIIITLLTVLITSSVSALNITLYYNETTGLYDESGDYTSSADNYGGSPLYACVIEWEEDTPSGTDITMQLRSGNAEPLSGDFIGPDGTSDTYYQTSPSIANSTHNSNTYIQWKSFLTTTDTSITPTLYNATYWCYSTCTSDLNCNAGLYCISNECVPNTAPEMVGITDSPDPIKGGTSITITANGVTDLQDDTLYLYCGTTTTPDSGNTICAGGTTSDTGDPYNLDCTFPVPTDDTTHTVYCRLYDGTVYSAVNSTTYTTDSTPPAAVTITSLDGDIASPYWDTSDNSQTIIYADRPDSGMLCRWSTTDIPYSSISSSNDCTMGEDSTQCNLGSLSQSASYTYHISCSDAVGNDQSTAQNTGITFGVDWTEPSTYVSGTGSYYVPGHEVIFHEEDNIGTPATILTWHCTSDLGCTPVIEIDNLEDVTFTERGTNYLRWYSKDAAGNDQPAQGVTVEINSLPVITDDDMFSGVEGSGDFTGQKGQKAHFYCKGTDSNGAVDGNAGYSAKIWLRVSGSGTWDRVNGVSMTWDSANNRFFYNLVSPITDSYNTKWDMMCEITDDLNEGANHTKNNVFTVVNTPPNVDEIFVGYPNAQKFDNQRWKCAVVDYDDQHSGNAMEVIFSLAERGYLISGPLLLDNVTMTWESGANYYYDRIVLEDGDTHYDAQCLAYDGVEYSSMRTELDVPEHIVSNDWDGDGVSDSADSLEGTGADLDTALSVTIKVDGIVNNSPRGSHTVTFEDNGVEFVRFTNDFDTNELLTPWIIVDRIATGEKGSVLVSGLEGISKTLRIPKLLGSGLICLKNSSVTSISEISSGCDEPDEILFANCGIGGETIGGITCIDKTTYYEVSGVTHSAVIEFGNARLEVWSEGTYWQLDDIFFYVNYTNSSSGAAITGADCNIWFDDTGWNDMAFDGTLHNYNRTFNSAGDRTYNVSCTHATYTNLTVQDSFTISQSAIPEFSVLTLGLGLIAVLIGLVIIRKRR